MWDLLDKGVGDLCMKPFSEIIIHGKAQSFVRTFPQFMKLQAHYTRDKVVRSYFSLLSTFRHGAAERNDLLRCYMNHCVDSNDNFIELFNSLISRSLPQTPDIDFHDVEDTSILVNVKRTIVESFQSSTHFNKDQDKKDEKISEGEILREEKKYLTAKARDDHKHIDEFLTNWFKSLARIQIHNKDFTTSGCMNSISSLLRNGQHRILSTVLPKYRKYLTRESRRIQVPLEAGGVQEEDIEYTNYIDQNFTEDMLNCAINFMPRKFTTVEKSRFNKFSNKRKTIEKVKVYYTRYELNALMIANRISTLTAKQILERFKESKKNIAQRRDEVEREDDH